MSEILTRIMEQLENARKDLLDLTLRNPLLNYRSLKSRGLEVLNSSVGETFQLLVRDKKALSFFPEKQAVKLPNESGVRQMPGEVVEHVSRTSLRTPYDEAELDKRLLRTHYAARTHIEEQGINVLYLALGMLSWMEADTESAKVLRAPLILIPVSLTRNSVQYGFQLVYTEEEISENSSLYKKLESDFRINLPRIPEQLDDWNPEEYLLEISQAVSIKSRWKLDATSHCLGFFSFGRFMMYKDLDINTWPDGKNPANHPLLKRLLGDGFDEPPAGIGDEEHIDEHLLPTDIHTVKDADSSQILSIIDVKRGRNLVVQGPPGTGKSQTITNMIAELLQDGKRVLFVAEKMAALQVVKSRLDEVGLGAACLELHSYKANKKLVLDNLQKTWRMTRPEPPKSTTDLKILKDYRDRLNAHAKLLHEPIGETGFTPYQAFGHLIVVRDKLPKDSPTIRLSGTWSGEEYSTKKALVEEVQSLLREVGSPVNHPFWGVELTEPPLDQDEIRRIIHKGRTALEQLTAYLSEIVRLYGLINFAGIEDVRYFLKLAEELVSSPLPDGVGLPLAIWIEHREDFQMVLKPLVQLVELHEKFDEKLGDAAWREPVKDDLVAFRNHAGRLFRMLNKGYRRARRHVGMILRRPENLKDDEAIRILEAIERAQEHDAVLQTKDELAQSVFGVYWSGAKTNWALLMNWTTWVLALCDDIVAGRKPEWIMDFSNVNGGKIVWREHIDKLTSLMNHWEQTLAELKKRLSWNDSLRFSGGTHLGAQPFIELEQWMEKWEKQIHTLLHLIHINQRGERLQSEGLLELRLTAERWEKANDHLTDVLDRAWFQSLVERAFRERSPLRNFAGAEHSRVVSFYQQLDRWHIKVNQEGIAASHWSRFPDASVKGQVGVLRNEFQKMRRHMPIRKLLLEAGRAVQSIKPVFMMSPMSVATYLAPGSVDFDVVIFDEASQVRPVDAFGSILRGRQVVVVGDLQQLPPNNFFEQLANDDEDEVESEHVAADMESILSLLSGRGVPERMLRWHYRSRHQSLIAVSNAEFYNNRLIVFPSPTISSDKAGLAYHYLPDTAYDRGGSRTNRQEAAAVARAVLSHAKENPGVSLGVVAFSAAQMDAIQAELEMLRKQNPDTERFFTMSGSDSFFVKNLENVQGDERDVIFISVGYGKDANGHITMKFGPLNHEGGERRLNVMISRARLRCELFTNLLPDDIDLVKTSSRGVKSFKIFLSYAKGGGIEVPLPTEREADSPFEVAVREALIRRGYRVDPQVGSGGFRIDLGVVDPDRPGKYLLGIECDGATYHRARSARDRDRLRQQVLEGLGWKLCRIWSTDWFRDSERELQRVIEAIEFERTAEVSQHHSLDMSADLPVAELKPSPEVGKNEDEKPVANWSSEVSKQTPPQMPGTTENRMESDASLKEANVSAVTAYRYARLQVFLRGHELYSVPRTQLAAWILEVVRVESPVHVDEVYKRVANAAGVKRIGARIRNALDLAVRIVSRDLVVRRGDFLWMSDMVDPPVRDRSRGQDVSRKMEHIAPEEIAAAIKIALFRTRGLEPQQLPNTVARYFGIQRLGEDSRAIIETVFESMMAERKITINGRYAIAVE